MALLIKGPVNLIAGVLTDLIGARSVLAASFIVQAMGIYVLNNLNPAHPHQAWIAGGLLGGSSALANIGLNTLIPDCKSCIFERKHTHACTHLLAHACLNTPACTRLLKAVAPFSALTCHVSPVFPRPFTLT